MDFSVYRQWFKKVLPNYKDLKTAPKVYRALVSQTNETQDSGVLTVGTTYQILDFQAGDDFMNLGASANENGVVFIPGNLTGTVGNTQANRVAVKQKDTITLTGTGGTANITGTGGLTKLVTFGDDLADTAGDFVTSHSAAYLLVGVVVTSDSDTIIFEASVAGTAFVSPVITNVTPNLAGTVVNTQVNVTAQLKIDTLVLTGTSGSNAIYTAGGLTKYFTFTTSLTATAAAFVTANAAAYAVQGITITSSSANILFTALVPGVTFSSPTIPAAATAKTFTNSTVLIYDYEPYVLELENTIGTITWTRYSVGQLYATSSGLFTEDKVFISPSLGFGMELTSANRVVALSWGSVNYLYVNIVDKTTDLNIDNSIKLIPIEFYLYP